MYNGSLDSDVMEFLKPYATMLEDIEGCNELVDTLASWLQTRLAWPRYFEFKGTRFEYEEDALAYIARYYITLGRNQRRIMKLKVQPLPELISLDTFWPDETSRQTEEYKRLKEKLDEPYSSVYTYVTGNSAEELLHNYKSSRLELETILQGIDLDISFPSFQRYEREVKETLKEVELTVKTALDQTELRTKALCMRLRYDFIQRRIETLEKT
jgi:hypothetical protein